MHLDTCFLIDLYREASGQRTGPATAFMEAHAAAAFAVSAIVLLEFDEGFADEHVHEARSFLAVFHILPVDTAVAARAARIRRTLRQSGCLLGDNDILIAATALHHDEALVTDNAAHFDRVPGLRTVDFRS